MFGNYLAAALRNLSRNRLYSVINIVGLAIGFAAAILIALFVRNETKFDCFMPNAERTFVLVGGYQAPGSTRVDNVLVPADFAASMKLDFPEIESIARINKGFMQGWMDFRHGLIESNESFVWADPNIFSLLQLPALYGDLSTALEYPDSIVITQRMAHKFFGKDNPVGENLEMLRTHTFKVTAVIKDFPPESHLKKDFIASGRAAFSELSDADTHPQCSECYLIDHQGLDGVLTYVRLKPGASIAALERAMPAYYARHRSAEGKLAAGGSFFFSFVALPDLHLRTDLQGMMNPAISPAILYAVSIVGILIVVVASINFINLMTARATRRAIEVGVRKTAGAQRVDLILQFISESTLYVILSMAIALLLVWQLLPAFNAFLDRSIEFAWWRDFRMSAELLGLVLGVGILAGSYPAFVLSAFRPATVLKSRQVQAHGSGSVRQALVILQFAILITLIISTGVIYRQTLFALNEGLRLAVVKERVFYLWSCTPALRDEIARLPGVEAVACSSGPALNLNYTTINKTVTTATGTKIVVATAQTNPGFFEFYGLHPLAGRFFSLEHGGDQKSADDKDPFQAPLVINETAARQIGFSSPQAAIGKSITLWVGGNAKPSEIIGVVGDFSTDSVFKPISATVYYFDPKEAGLLSIKLNGRQLGETMTSIEKLWSQFGNPSPFDIYSLDHFMLELFADVMRQAPLFAAVSSVALLIACLGLFGLAAFTAEQRTKEIGIRKAMGAENWDIVRLLVWRFTKPVLWANLIAWPISFLLINRWLHGFAYHIDLKLWMFFAAGGLALTIAWLTVGSHALLVARAKPVKALRYE